MDWAFLSPPAGVTVPMEGTPSAGVGGEKAWMRSGSGTGSRRGALRPACPSLVGEACSRGSGSLEQWPSLTLGLAFHSLSFNYPPTKVRSGQSPSEESSESQ